MPKIHRKKIINLELTNEKVLALSILTILKVLLDAQMIWMIFIKALQNTIQ